MLLVLSTNVVANITIFDSTTISKIIAPFQTTLSPPISTKISNVPFNPAVINLLMSREFSSFRNLALHLLFDGSDCGRDLKIFVKGLKNLEEWALQSKYNKNLFILVLKILIYQSEYKQSNLVFYQIIH